MIDSLSHPLTNLPLQRLCTSHNMLHSTEILDIKEIKKGIICSKVRAILLDGWILPVGEVPSERGW